MTLGGGGRLKCVCEHVCVCAVGEMVAYGRLHLERPKSLISHGDPA